MGVLRLGSSVEVLDPQVPLEVPVVVRQVLDGVLVETLGEVVQGGSCAFLETEHAVATSLDSSTSAAPVRQVFQVDGW
jgi:hypothetical protein